MNKESKNITRRDFIKIMTAAGVTTAGLAACETKEEKTVTKKEKGSMTFRKNERTGDNVSLLGFGMMRLPTIEPEDKESNEEKAIDQEEVNRLVDHAIANGVNYFDTAPVYCRGLSERATGIALKRHPREKVFIATKLSNFSEEMWTKEATIAMYHNSMKELQTDYIDYLLLHSLGRNAENTQKRFIDNGVIDYMLEERKAGRVRNLGFSFHGDKENFDMLMEMHEKYHWDFVQIQMNYVDWKYATKQNKRNTDAEYLYEELAKRNIPVVIMEPLLGGRLANVPDAVVKMMKEHDPEASVASWAFRFTGTYPKVLNVLSGMTRMEHLEDNINTFSPLVPLNDSEQEMLQKAAEIMTTVNNVPCTACQYCMPCPYGVDIPGIFTHHNKCLNEGEIATNSQDENYKKARRKYLINYDRRVEPLRQANHCIGCGKCVEHCPQNIKIPRELRHIDEYVENLKQGKL